MTGTLISKHASFSRPVRIITEYEFNSIAASTDSTATEAIKLIAPLQGDASIVLSSSDLTGDAYIISLDSIMVSSNSTNLTVRILNEDDPLLVKTINEVITVSAVNLFTRQIPANEHILKTEDGYLYFMFENADGANATGTIRVELIYTMLRSNELS